MVSFGSATNVNSEGDGHYLKSLFIRTNKIFNPAPTKVEAKPEAKAIDAQEKKPAVRNLAKASKKNVEEIKEYLKKQTFKAFNKEYSVTDDQDKKFRSKLVEKIKSFEEDDNTTNFFDHVKHYLDTQGTSPNTPVLFPTSKKGWKELNDDLKELLKKFEHRHKKEVMVKEEKRDIVKYLKDLEFDKFKEDFQDEKTFAKD